MNLAKIQYGGLFVYWLLTIMNIIRKVSLSRFQALNMFMTYMIYLQSINIEEKMAHYVKKSLN